MTTIIETCTMKWCLANVLASSILGKKIQDIYTQTG